MLENVAVLAGVLAIVLLAVGILKFVDRFQPPRPRRSLEDQARDVVVFLLILALIGAVSEPLQTGELASDDSGVGSWLALPVLLTILLILDATERPPRGRDPVAYLAPWILIALPVVVVLILRLPEFGGAQGFGIYSGIVVLGVGWVSIVALGLRRRRRFAAAG